jgi:hypothetical protein
MMLVGIPWRCTDGEEISRGKGSTRRTHQGALSQMSNTVVAKIAQVIEGPRAREGELVLTANTPQDRAHLNPA